MGNKIKTRRIAVLIRTRFASGRDILYGIRRYSSRHFKWLIHVIYCFDEDTMQDFKRLISEGVDGIIVNGVGFTEIGRLVGEIDIPTVVMGSRTPEMGRRTDSLVFVRADSRAVGLLAARYFATLGHFRSYAFIPTNQWSYASNLRLNGFKDEIERNGNSLSVFPPVLSRADGSIGEIHDLAAWLKSLPKPIALLAAYDQRAMHVLEAAALCGLKVPRDLSVIGVDNDLLICEFTSPPLSSIQVDHVRLGEIAAMELDKLMDDGKRMRVRTIKTREIHLVERESSKAISPGVKLVERALTFIERNAVNGISAADVSSHLHVSRSLLDLRFRESAGTSVKEAILTRKLDELKRLLTETSTPISKITTACGFRSENSAKNLFRSRFGCTMSGWRNQR